jgi:hypothetical protein
MIQLLSLLIALFPLGDSSLLRYHLPDVTTSAFNLGLNDGTALYPLAHSTETRLTLRPDYELLRLGERMNLALNASLNTDAPTFDVITAAPGDTYKLLSAFYFRPDASADMDWYPLRFPLGLGADFGADCKLKGNAETVRHDRSTGRSSSRDFSFVTSLDVGPSLGRFRDAQTVIQALRIFEILAQERQALRAANEDDVQMLADLLAAKPSYSLHFHQPEKDWFVDLEALLKNRGLTHARMPARTWFLIREAIETATQLARPVGWRLSVRPGAELTAGSHWVMGWTTSHRSLYPRLALGLETGYPLSRRLQFSQSASWHMTADTTVSRTDLAGSVEIDYHVFDRFIATAGYSASYADREHYGDMGQQLRSYLRHGPALSAAYFREDRLRANASLGLDWARYRETSPSSPLVRGTSLNWSLSLRYRLSP